MVASRGTVSLVLCACLVASRAMADDAPRESAVPAQVASGFVEVAVAADDGEVRDLANALGELVGRLGLEARVRRLEVPPATIQPSSEPGARRAFVWIDTRSVEGVAITVTILRGDAIERRSTRTVVRPVSEAIEIEQVSHVAYSVLETALATEATEPGPLLGPPPPPSPPPPAAAPSAPSAQPPLRKAPPPSASSPDRFGLDATAMLTAREVAPRSGIVFGGGGALTIAAPSVPLRPSVWLAGSIDAPFDERAPNLTFETSVASLRALPAISVLRVREIEIDLGAGGGVDLLHTKPRDARVPWMVPSPHTYVEPVIAGQLVARVRAGPTARILFGFGVDTDTHGEHFDSGPRGNAPPLSVIQAWQMRAVGLVGLCVPLAGTSPCSGTP